MIFSNTSTATIITATSTTSAVTIINATVFSAELHSLVIVIITSY